MALFRRRKSKEDSRTVTSSSKDLGYVTTKEDVKDESGISPNAAPKEEKHTPLHRAMPSVVVECTICFAQKANAIIIECGHGGICYDCAIKLLQAQHVCPFCRKKALAVYRIEGTDRASIMQASDAAVCVMPGEDKNKVREALLNLSVRVESPVAPVRLQMDPQQGHH